MEAMQQGFGQLFLFGFAIQAKARELLEKMKSFFNRIFQ